MPVLFRTAPQSQSRDNEATGIVIRYKGLADPGGKLIQPPSAGCLARRLGARQTPLRASCLCRYRGAHYPWPAPRSAANGASRYRVPDIPLPLLERVRVNRPRPLRPCGLAAAAQSSCRCPGSSHHRDDVDPSTRFAHPRSDPAPTRASRLAPLPTVATGARPRRLSPTLPAARPSALPWRP